MNKLMGVLLALLLLAAAAATWLSRTGRLPS